MDEMNEDEMLAELGVPIARKPARARTPREERIIAGFEDIVKFFEQHGRPPRHGDERDIFERLYAVRLDRLREQDDCRELLSDIDTHGLLTGAIEGADIDALDDEAMLAELGVAAPAEGDLTNLKHVQSREERRAAEEIANRTVCADFAKFKPLFDAVRKDIAAGIRSTRPFQNMAEIKQGEYFIVGGQIAFVAELKGEFVTDYDRRDSRLRVIYDNGTESDILLRSLQRALHRDEAGRRITNPSAGPLFGSETDDEDLEAGTIYVLRSKSDHPTVAAHRDLIHKIGVTGGAVETRIAAAAVDATYLLAGVEIVATYKLYNINRTKLENLLHRVFSSARLDLTIMDRFGNPVHPREWFLVPLAAIDEAVERVRDQSILDYEYDPATARLAVQRP
jgi:hypothetical protein